MTYVLQNRRGKNFFRWIWLLIKLNRVLFHDIQKEIDNGKRVILMLPGTYLIYRTIEAKGARLQGARVIPKGEGLTVVRHECKD